jgi:hydroxymethylpyrimidine pyrophosphatase-like HAD family hydrolase
MPGAGDDAVHQWSRAEGGAHVWAEVVDRVIGMPVVEQGDEAAGDLEDAAFARRNGTDGDDRHEGYGGGIGGGRRTVGSGHDDSEAGGGVRLPCSIPPMADRKSAAVLRHIRLLVLDVDGTLTNSRHEVDAATCAAVARVRAAGIRVLLATGRRYRDTLPIAARVGVDGPLITASGALVKRPTDHATVFRAAFAPGVLEGVVAAVVAAGHEPVLYADSFAAGFDFFCRGLPAADAARSAGTEGSLDDYLAFNRGLARVDPDLHRRPPPGVFAGFAMGDRPAMIGLEESLTATFPTELSLHTIRSPRYLGWMCEIAPALVTKWTGVLAVARDWGIAAEEICAVGDDVNDLPMIVGAGLGVAMGNGQPAVREAADMVVASHDAGGLVEVADLLVAASA